MLDVHTEWLEDIYAAYSALDPQYREFIERGSFIPERSGVFNAFKTLPKSSLRYILFGQDPYPRAESATGYAFIDGAVEEIFSGSGLHKRVNRATSLRNFIKMALVADGRLDSWDTSQEAIVRIDKSDLINTIDELRLNFEKNGVLLLNMALIFEEKSASRRHVKEWAPFIGTLLGRLQSDTVLILFGNMAKRVLAMKQAQKFEKICLEHPYNHTFITNHEAHSLFAPMRLLGRQ